MSALSYLLPQKRRDWHLNYIYQLINQLALETKHFYLAPVHNSDINFLAYRTLLLSCYCYRTPSASFFCNILTWHNYTDSSRLYCVCWVLREIVSTKPQSIKYHVVKDHKQSFSADNSSSSCDRCSLTEFNNRYYKMRQVTKTRQYFIIVFSGCAAIKMW